MRYSFLTAAFAALTAACPDHDVNIHQSRINKRADGTQDWAYDASYDWGRININYTLCQTGTQQSPIQLSLTQGLAQTHLPTFNYTSRVRGALYNWGYGPAFTLNGTDMTTHPSVTYDNETVYLKGWHIHAPADHSVGGDRSKAELHLVHADATGKEKAVFAIRIDPGTRDSQFFQQFIEAANENSTTSTILHPAQADPKLHRRVTTPSTISSFPGFESTERIQLEMDARSALQEVNMFADFWTYRGSLTSPPCTEGIRFFVARNIMFVGHEQMREVLAVSTYSARVEQEVWLHGINA